MTGSLLYDANGWPYFGNEALGQTRGQLKDMPVYTRELAQKLQNGDAAVADAENAATAAQASAAAAAASAAQARARRLGVGRLTTTPGLPQAPAWGTLATIVAISHGGLCEVDVDAILSNDNSGANRSAGLSVTCDGVALTPAQTDHALFLFTGAAAPTSCSFKWESTPAPGSHTWVLRANCSNSSAAVSAKNAVMTVVEYGGA